ncbi:transposase [Bacillus cereus group sp. BfR-BA-01383]|uniref:transposase n=1 Tax=Bacillus cereus group sp. BfR-BA-01383 TaxID=2920327 RepID=UPI001F55F447|nr:transposase [Bacillus cereus group sp. BfR-BA-01383]
MKTTLSHSNQPTIESLQAQVEELTAKVRWYKEQFRLRQQKRFGTSSEKTLNNQLALEMFNEAEKKSDSETPEPAVETITYRRKKKRGHTDESVQNLPVETAKENNLSPYHYLLYLFETLPNIDLNNKKEIDKVLPWSTDLPSRCRVLKKSEVNKK